MLLFPFQFGIKGDGKKKLNSPWSAFVVISGSILVIGLRLFAKVEVNTLAVDFNKNEALK